MIGLVISVHVRSPAPFFSSLPSVLSSMGLVGGSHMLHKEKVGLKTLRLPSQSEQDPTACVPTVLAGSFGFWSILGRRLPRDCACALVFSRTRSFARLPVSGSKNAFSLGLCPPVLCVRFMFRFRLMFRLRSVFCPVLCSAGFLCFMFSPFNSSFSLLPQGSFFPSLFRLL